jgi:hypothetical protein
LSKRNADAELTYDGRGSASECFVDERVRDFTVPFVTRWPHILPHTVFRAKHTVTGSHPRKSLPGERDRKTLVAFRAFEQQGARRDQ